MLIESFATFVTKVEPGGWLLVHETVPDTVLLARQEGVRVMKVGQGCEIDAVDVSQNAGRYSFVPVLSGRELPRVQLKVLGDFQVTNALFALGLAYLAHGDPVLACRGLSDFTGVARRLEIREAKAHKVLFDYGHHPAEIDAVLGAVRSAYPEKKVLVAFQPHQFSRTLHLLDDFADVLARADSCLIADIYAAREDPNEDHGVCAADLAHAIGERGGRARAAGPVDGLGGSILAELAIQKDLVENEADSRWIPLVLGAGELDGVVEELVRSI